LFAQACLFLAAKLEESPRKYKDLLSTFHLVEQQLCSSGQPQCFDLNSYELIDRKEALLTAERTLIKELGFSMQTL
jgi:hypothetical protein